MLKMPQTVLNLLLGVLIVNVIGLWTVYLLAKPNKVATEQSAQIESTVGEVNNQTPSDNTQEELVVKDDSELQELKEQLSEVTEKVASLTAVNQDQAQDLKSSSPDPNTSTVKEYVVYLGTGATYEKDWTTLESTKTSLDSNNYPALDEVLFQAALKIMNGEAQARLINTSTGAILAATEIQHNTSTTTWKTSTPFILHPGKQEYAVQLRSTSGEKAELAGARLIIKVR